MVCIFLLKVGQKSARCTDSSQEIKFKRCFELTDGNVGLHQVLSNYSIGEASTNFIASILSITPKKDNGKLNQNITQELSLVKK